ncbi:MAG: nickel-dependent lactate racemase [Candidatus Hydrogenedentota bacterium]
MAIRKKIRLPYGHGVLEAVPPPGVCLGVLDVADAPAVNNPGAALCEALANPIGTVEPLSIDREERVTIIVSDAFRHTGIDQLLPTLLDYLREAGATDQNIQFVFATGTHRPPTPDEQAQILGEEVFDRFKACAFPHAPHDEAQLVEVGTTSRGTRVRLNRRVVESDRVIVTGAVVLHYFGGFGGGRKSILPGIAAADSIAMNHARNLHPTDETLNPNVRIGAMEGNPVAEDMQEAADFCRCDLLVNTVLNRDGAIAGIYAGGLTEAHAAATRHAHRLFAVNIAELADLVIASAGPAKNWVQSHKALFNAYQAVRPEGRIVLAARTPEGYGGNKFAQWIGYGSRQAIIAELRQNAEINGQTALSTIGKARITTFITELSGEEVAAMGGRKAPDLATAVTDAVAELRAAGIAQPRYYVLPSAAYTVPFLDQEAPLATGP